VGGRALRKKLRFYAFQPINQSKLRFSRKAMELCRSSICIFIEVSAKNQFKIRFLDRCFGFLSFWRVKTSYLIRTMSKNSNFLCEMLFLCLKHAYKKSLKNSTSRSLFETFMSAKENSPFFLRNWIAANYRCTNGS